MILKLASLVLVCLAMIPAMEGEAAADGSACVGVYRPSTTEWFLDKNCNGYYEPGYDIHITSGQFGQPSDYPLAADFRPQAPPYALSTIGVFNAGHWWLDTAAPYFQWAAGDAYIPGPFGQAGDHPVAGFWAQSAHDLCTTAACIGAFNNGTWWLDVNESFTFDAGDFVTTFGQSGDLPVVGQFTANGYEQSSHIGVYRNGEWFIDTNYNGIYDVGDLHIPYPNFGQPGDIPVAGNWSSNLEYRDCIGTFNGGTWWLDYNCDNVWNAYDRTYHFGQPGDIPVTGNWGN